MKKPSIALALPALILLLNCQAQPEQPTRNVAVTLPSGMPELQLITGGMDPSVDVSSEAQGAGERMIAGGTSPELDDRPSMAMIEDQSPILLEPEFVMDTVALLPSDEGFDLTGDGASNNALALLFSDPLVGRALGGDPNEFIERSVRRGELLLLLDFRELNDFTYDDSHHIDIFLGRDSDERRRDNFRGGESFLISCSSLTENLQPESRFEDVTLKDGELSGESGQFRFLVSFSNTEVLLREARITGHMNEGGDRIEDGRIGGAVTYADLEEVVLNDPEIGPDFARIMLGFLSRQLDIDLDKDGTNDALSASFAYSAVRARILRQMPCEP